MVKPTGPGVYTATYSNVPVYEFQFGEGLKEHVMRRRSDDWINATHILKAAGFDKPARTRILEREVQKENHEKVQGGYGKYQGTWVPLEQGQALAQRNNIYEKLRTIFEYIPGNESPPPAPKHTTNKPKIPKKPAVPKWSNMAAPRPADDYDNISAQLNDDESMPDDTTVASASFMGDDDRYDVSRQSTGHRKRKREDHLREVNEQAHIVWADELLDYFLLSNDSENVPKPEPPPNFQADWIIDSDGHTAMHWAAAMGDVDLMKQLKRFGANLAPGNEKAETPLMRCVMFTNCLDKQAMPQVVKELITTIDTVDYCNATALHHAAAVTAQRHKHTCARYYLDIILNKLQETFDPEHVQRLLDYQDIDGNTAVHIAAKFKARKCVRALIGRGASTDIPNHEHQTAADIIRDLNDSRRMERYAAASSSPFAPDSQRHTAYHDALGADPTRRQVAHHSEAAMSVESKITPLVQEKFAELARSFDEELRDKEESEKEAKRILNSTHLELATIREQILEITYREDDDTVESVNVARLSKVEDVVTSLIEKQQQIQLLARAQHEESKQNGHLAGGDDISERVMLARMLNDEQNKRQKLVHQYRDALGMAGAGEKGEKYRRLISKCVGVEVETMDENLNSLIDQLMEQEGDKSAEVDFDKLPEVRL